jgi:hypothetical protein
VRENVFLSVKLTGIIEIKENEKKTHKYTHTQKEIEKIVRSGKNKKSKINSKLHENTIKKSD